MTKTYCHLENAATILGSAILNEHRRAKRWTALLCSPASHLPAKSQGAAAPDPALVGRESPVVFKDRLLRAQWGGRARKDASEGYK